MINEELIKRYLIEKQDLKKLKIKERELKININNKYITAIIGPRRVGKTYLALKHLIKHKNFLYIDFENPIFFNFEPLDIIKVLDIYYHLFKEKEPTIFLDEIQNIKNWESLVRLLHEKNLKIIISGSSSKLLSKEIATQLRGRTLSYYLFPLTFKEFLDFKNIKIKSERDIYSYYQEIKSLLNEYLEFGSFPQVVLENNKENKKRLIKEYLDLIVFKDIVERYKIKNKFLINELIYFCLNNYSSTISFDSIYKLFKQKYKISKKTIVNYFQYLENSFFIFLLKKYSNSLKERIVSKRKLYLIDLSFSIFGNKEITKDLENIVFLELTKQKYYKNLNLELFYYKTKENYEVDFLIKEKGRIKELINVTYANSYEEINEREIRSLLHAKEELKLSNKIPLTIITWDYEDKKEISWFGKKGVISFIPLWKWLLKI